MIIMNSEEQFNSRSICKSHLKKLCLPSVSILTVMLLCVAGGLGVYLVLDYPQITGKVEMVVFENMNHIIC